MWQDDREKYERRQARLLETAHALCPYLGGRVYLVKPGFGASFSGASFKDAFVLVNLSSALCELGHDGNLAPWTREDLIRETTMTPEFVLGLLPRHSLKIRMARHGGGHEVLYTIALAADSEEAYYRTRRGTVLGKRLHELADHYRRLVRKTLSSSEPAAPAAGPDSFDGWALLERDRRGRARAAVQAGGGYW